MLDDNSSESSSRRPMASLHILFGTQTRVSEEVSFTIARQAKALGICHVHVLPADDLELCQWASLGHPVVIVCSTTGQGEAPATIQKTWDILRMSDASPLAGLQYAIFGLGDSSYPKYNYMAKMLHNRLRQLDAHPLVFRGLGDDQDPCGYEEGLATWLPGLWAACGLGQTENFPKAALLQKFHVSFGAPEAKTPKMSTAQDGEETGLFSPEAFVTMPEVDRLAAPARGVPRMEQMVEVRVLCNERLTAEDYTLQAVHHLELTRPAGCDYQPGDALGVYPTNRLTRVEFLLRTYGYSGEEAICVTPWVLDATTATATAAERDRSPVPVVPVGCYDTQPRMPFHGQTCHLRTWLTHYVDLDAVTPRSFLWMMSHYATGDEEVRERLMELSTGTMYYREYMDYCYKEKRGISEVLFDFPTVRPPLAMVLSYAPAMQPRLFSLASSPRQDLDAFHLTVGRLHWTTPYKRARYGLCSDELCHVQPGSCLEVFLQAGSLQVRLGTTATKASGADGSHPTGSHGPLLLVGTGTGVAPLRSIVREWLSYPPLERVPLLLFLGFRFQAKDYLYGPEWKRLQEEMKNTQGTGVTSQRLPYCVEVAFSRDTVTVPEGNREGIDADKADGPQQTAGAPAVGQPVPSVGNAPGRRYVQHLIARKARVVGAFLQDPTCCFILCGNAKQMPRDVETTVLDVMAQVCCAGSEEKAAAMRKQMGREGRYQEDTWSV